MKCYLYYEQNQAAAGYNKLNKIDKMFLQTNIKFVETNNNSTHFTISGANQIQN